MNCIFIKERERLTFTHSCLEINIKYILIMNVGSKLSWVFVRERERDGWVLVLEFLLS